MITRPTTTINHGRLFALALLLSSTFVFFFVPVPIVRADAIRTSGGGLSQATANTLYCQLAGCTMTGTLTSSAAAPDITSTTNTDLTIRGAGTGSVALGSGDGNIDLEDSTFTVRGLIGVSSTNITVRGNASTIPTIIGPTANVGATSIAGSVNDGASALLQVYGEGIVVNVPRTALAIASPTDTTTTPVGGNASTQCRMSSTGVAAWTPSETGAVDGMGVCCTNTGANTITMTASSTVYEGTGAVAQWKTVCFDYVTDRWVQRSISP